MLFQSRGAAALVLTGDPRLQPSCLPREEGWVLGCWASIAGRWGDKGERWLILWEDEPCLRASQGPAGWGRVL